MSRIDGLDFRNELYASSTIVKTSAPGNSTVCSESRVLSTHRKLSFSEH